MEGQIFICYRRDDTPGSTGRIYDHVVSKFSPDQVFLDIDTVGHGDDFVEKIESAVSKCDVFIAIIGRRWLHLNDRMGRRLLDNPNDFVRIEIRAALQRNICVIPVLVENASMPGIDDLPEDIQPLSRRNAIDISHSRFYSDVARLISDIEKVLKERSSFALLTSAWLAIGYVNDYIAPVCDFLFDKGKVKIEGVLYKKFEMHIVIPSDLKENMRFEARSYFRENGFKQYTLKGGLHGINITTAYRVAEDDPTKLILCDMPTTLNALYNAIVLYHNVGQVGRSTKLQLVEARELNNFKLTLQTKLNENSFYKKTVKIFGGG